MDRLVKTTYLTRVTFIGLFLLCTALTGQPVWAMKNGNEIEAKRDTITQPQERINVLQYSMLSHYQPEHKPFAGKGMSALLNHAFLQFGYDCAYQAGIGEMKYTPAQGFHGSLGGEINKFWSLRLHGGYSLVEDRRQLNNIHTGFMRLDAMLNFTSWLYGYRPDRQWNVLPYAGIGANATYHLENLKFGPSAEVGMEIRTRISKYGHIYVAPYLTMAKNKIEYEYSHNWREYDSNIGLRVGLLYYIHNKDLGDEGPLGIIKHALDDSFIEVGYGQNRWKYQGTDHPKDWNTFSQISVGKWINPYFGIKGGLAVGEGYYGIFEGLVDPIRLIMGEPEELTTSNPMLEDLRRFHLNASTGFVVGVSDRKTERINVRRPIQGWTASVQGLYDITPKCAIFVAPRVMGSYSWLQKKRAVRPYADLQLQLQVGLRFNLDY